MDKRIMRSILSDFKNEQEGMEQTIELIEKQFTSDNSDYAKYEKCCKEIEKFIDENGFRSESIKCLLVKYFA